MLNNFIITSSLLDLQLHTNKFEIPGYSIEHDVLPSRYGVNTVVQNNNIQYDDLNLEIPLDNENLECLLKIIKIFGNNFDHSGNTNTTFFDLTVKGTTSETMLIVNFNDCLVSGMSGLEFGSATSSSNVNLTIKYSNYNIEIVKVDNGNL